MTFVFPLLLRRCLAEFIGTAFLLAIVIGSGIMATNMTDNVALQLLCNTTATAAGLVALILALGPVSGAHFNPVVTIADRVFGGMKNRELLPYFAAQVSGAIVGVIIANLMFSLPAIEASTKVRDGGGIWLGEIVATLGLLLVIFGVVRSGRSTAAPFAVAGYIAAAYFFTSSTSFANPAVTIARSLSDTFAGIAPESVLGFIAMQLVGMVLAIGVIWVLFPTIGEVADEILLRHNDITDTESVPEVLFVCVHNAGRSQMAAALLAKHGAGRVVVRSAGSAPADQLNPAVIEAMAEVGIDLLAGGAHPKKLTEAAVQASDVVITMGCGDACPFFPGKRYLDWVLEDPAGQGVESVRPIRDEIERRVLGLLDELAV